jgi:hypothetical protein
MAMGSENRAEVPAPSWIAAAAPQEPAIVVVIPVPTLTWRMQRFPVSATYRVEASQVSPMGLLNCAFAPSAVPAVPKPAAVDVAIALFAPAMYDSLLSPNSWILRMTWLFLSATKRVRPLPVEDVPGEHGVQACPDDP